jgi:hypothetical protein
MFSVVLNTMSEDTNSMSHDRDFRRDPRRLFDVVTFPFLVKEGKYGHRGQDKE